MDAETLKSFLPEFTRYIGRFADCSCDHRCREHLPVYIRGQLSNRDRKSVEPIAVASGVAVRTLREFLALLSWDHGRSLDRLRRIVAAERAGPGSVGLLDETSFVKKGTKTPGVQRQWCGTSGKVDNCVVTVHRGYTQGDFRRPLDGDLFLPESWDADRERCRAAGIPESIAYRPKWRIALEQYDRAVADGARSDRLTFDEGYGGKPEFLKGLTSRGRRRVAEVPKSVCGRLVRPRVTERPCRTNRRGRPRTKPRLVGGQPHARRADGLPERHPQLRDVPWTQYRLDDRPKGPGVWEVKHVRFHPRSDDGLPGETEHLPVARHLLQDADVKYFRSNAPEGTPTATLLRVAPGRAVFSGSEIGTGFGSL